MLIMCLFFTLFCLSSALDAVIALLMHGHMGDIQSLPVRQNMLAAPLLFVSVRFNVCVCVLQLKGSFN